MDEIRNAIWDFLYRAGGPQSPEEIATSLNIDVAAVLEAVQHEWFTSESGKIDIARVAQ